MGMARYEKRRFFNVHLLLSLGIWLYAFLSIHLSVPRRAGAWCERCSPHHNPARSSRLLRWVRSSHTVLGKLLNSARASSSEGDEFCEWRICMFACMYLYLSTATMKARGSPTAGNSSQAASRP